MKQIIVILIFLIALSSITFADIDMNLTIETDGDIDSTIRQIADGNITTHLYCNGENCTTNVYGGNINVPENQSFDYYDYSSYSTEVSGSNGLSLSSLIYTLGKVVNDYPSGNKPGSRSLAWDFWSMLDYKFVTHDEFEPTRNNLNYLAEEIDALKAENKLLKIYLDITLDEMKLDCETALFKANRTGLPVETDMGHIVDLEVHGKECLTFKTVKTEPTNFTNSTV